MNIKMSHIKPIFYCITTVLLSALIGFTLIYSSYLIDTKKSKPNIRQSALILLQENDIFPRINTTLPGSKKDNFTTSLMLNIASFSDTENAILHASTNPRAEYNHSNNHANLFASSFHNSSASATVLTYPRYWHGYIPILRPLLNILDLSQIRQLNLVIGLLLFLTTLVIINKKLGIKIALSYTLSIFFLNPITMLTSLPYINIYYITLIAIIVLLITNIKPYKIFLFSGIFTAYFDMLSAPIVSLGLPLIIFCLKSKTTLKNDLKNIIILCLTFSFGFSFMILQKWIITSIITENNIFNDIYPSLLWRINGDTYIETGLIQRGYTVTLKRNFYELKSSSTFIVITTYLLLITLIFLLKKEYTLNKDYRQLLLLLLSTIPFLWYALFQNHSFVHPLMAYRGLSIFIFAISSIISLTLKSSKKQKNNP